MKYLFYIFFFLFCAATTVTAQTVSQVRSQSTDPTYTPSGAVTAPPLCYNRTTHHLWGYAGGYWYDLTGGTYVDLDPSPTNEKIVSFSVVAGVLRINENGIFYNVPINDIIAAANISSSSPTITVTNVAGVVTVTSTDPDESVTNELQNLNLAGQTLSISSGNNVALPVVGVTAGVGMSTSSAAGVITVNNTSPDQTVTLIGAGINAVTGTYPNFMITGTEVDGSTTNECNTAFALTVDSLKITDNCGTLGVPLSAFGTPTFADNGLEMAGDTVHLGGELHKNTSISQLGYNLIIDNVHTVSGLETHIEQSNNIAGIGGEGVGFWTENTDGYLSALYASGGIAVNSSQNAANTQFSRTLNMSGIGYQFAGMSVSDGTTQNDFNVNTTDITVSQYPNTRDDSGVTPPINFLYTDANGVVQSAPTALIATSGAAKVANGLYTSNDTIKLGGALIENTLIDNDIYNLENSVIDPFGNALTEGNYYNNAGFGNGFSVRETKLENTAQQAKVNEVWFGDGAGAKPTIEWSATNIATNEQSAMQLKPGAMTLESNKIVQIAVTDAAGDLIIVPPNSGTATAGDVLTLMPSGSTLWQPASAQDTTAWRLTGNAGTTAGTNFVGTTDAQDLVLKTNGVEIARFGQQSNVAIGDNLVGNVANSYNSYAIGMQCVADATSSFAIGESNEAWGIGSWAITNGSQSYGLSSFALLGGAAVGNNSMAAGGRAFSYGEYNFGNVNTPYTPISTAAMAPTDRLFSIGNGDGDSSNSTLMGVWPDYNNALTLWKDGRSMWNGDIAKANTWIGVNGTNPQNFINVTTPTGSLAAISTEHTTSGNYAVLGSNAGNSGLVINNTKQFAFTTTAGTTSTALGATTTVANYSNTGFLFGGGGAATSTLDVTGSFALQVLIVNASITLNDNHCSIECNNGATPITITLPAATTCRGRIYMVHRNAGSTGTITITPTAGQIQALNGTLGATTSITALGNYGQHVWFQSDGTNWVRIN